MRGVGRGVTSNKYWNLSTKTRSLKAQIEQLKLEIWKKDVTIKDLGSELQLRKGLEKASLDRHNEIMALAHALKKKSDASDVLSAPPPPTSTPALNVSY